MPTILAKPVDARQAATLVAAAVVDRKWDFQVRIIGFAAKCTSPGGESAYRKTLPA
jgi:hypothetical protein